MRLDISWKLNGTEPYWSIWKSTNDSLRVDQDLNNYGKDNFTTWWTVLRTINYYREFINENTVAERQGVPIMIRPDLDNSYIGNAAHICGLTDAQ
jgi:alpha-galactosidase